MRHVLIIDDEIHAVRGLAAGVQWEQLGINEEYVHLAYSVKQGQDIFREYPISILICDIEMPQLTGIDMQQWVRKHYPDVVTIFLTCHADFSYVQRALQLGSYNYLLKPVDYVELEDVIRSAIAKYDMETSKNTYEKMVDHYRKLWESQKPIIAERFWQELFKRSFSSTLSVMKDQLERFGLEYREDIKYLPTLLKVKRWHKELNLRDEQIINYAIRNVAIEGLQVPIKKLVPVQLEDNKGLVLLLQIQTDDEINDKELLNRSNEFIKFCKEHLYCDVCYYIGAEVNIYNVFGVVQRLIEMDKNNFVHINKTFIIDDWIQRPTDIPKVSWDSWLRMMKAQDDKLLLQHIENYFTGLRQGNYHVDAKYVHLFYQDFLQLVFTFLYQEGLEVSQVFDRKGLTSDNAKILKTVDTLQEWVSYIVSVTMNQVHSLKKNMTVVEKAAQYIKDHIAVQDLSREDIAKHVFLNPDYLTRIFKKETGLSISDYTQQCRIDYAKTLLTETNHTVSEIAVTVGYSNISYFSTIFKKITKVNPIDYRKLSKKNNQYAMINN